MKKGIKRIISTVFATEVLAVTLLIGGSQVNAAKPEFITGTNTFNSDTSGYYWTTTPTFTEKELTKLGDGQHYIPVVIDGVKMAYASLDPSKAKGYSYNKAFAFSSVDKGDTVVNPFTTYPVGSRLTILNKFKFPDGKYDFSVVAAQEDGGRVANFYMYPEYFVGGNFDSDADKWLDNTSHYTYDSSKTTGTDEVIFIIRAESGNLESDSDISVPIVWSQADLDEFPHLKTPKTFYMSEYPYMYITYKPFTYTLKQNLNGTVSTLEGHSSTIERYGVNDVSITAPTIPGYTFKNWSIVGTKSQSGISNDTFQEMISSEYFYSVMFQDATITANYTINNYPLTVNPNGGTWKGKTTSL